MSRDSLAFFREQPGFWSVHLLFWGVGFAALGWLGYQESFLWLHSLHTPWLDAIMPHFTHIGDGLLLASGASLLLTRKSVPLALVAILSMLSTLIAINLLKNGFFSDWARPLGTFGIDHPELDYLSVRELRSRSFPSGHACASAAAMSLISFGYTRHKWLSGILMGVFAILLYESRVYIGVHFLGDILVGSLLGIALSALSLWLFGGRLTNWWEARSMTFRRRFKVGLNLLSILLLLVSISQIILRFY
ncbi:phosphatase PAP2 family protein [Pontibacter sp. G13]|uniref:phosphatase PAP2 family protein n=1 Tax=Pontibacter sp. G13 TaxID=3074898 RepID=UPI00288B7185|nr:phosphatase PAP2 family protein [Pontibacter sp. G13]WNJ18709.1 phosphatase PAP2 family protein [Pontibacter sp. G13]